MKTEFVSQVVTEAAETLRLHARTVDVEGRFPVESMKVLRESGLMGLLVPVAFGGLDGDVADLAAIAAELAGGCVSTALVWAMHCQQVDVLVRHAGPELREDLLPKIAAGGVYLASVTTEAGKGGHLLSAVDALRGDRADLVVERSAPIVTGGSDADGYLVTMRAAQDAASHEVTLVYAARDQLEVQVRGGWDAMGMRGTDSRPLTLTGRVPAHQVVGEPGGFRAIALDSMIPLAHIGWSACWLGGARGVLRDLVGAMRDRTWTPDLDSDLVRERLARIRIDLELVAAYLGRMCAELCEVRAAGRALDLPAEQIRINTLKVAAAELTFSAADRMMQLSGLARGYSRTDGAPVERVFRDLRSASLNYANDRLLTAIGALLPMDRSVRLPRCDRRPGVPEASAERRFRALRLFGTPLQEPTQRKEVRPWTTPP